MILGITGGIASGKSTVSEYLRQKGIPIVDADEISRSITKKGQKGAQAVYEKLGADFFSSGELDRKKLAEYCFNNKERTELLNSILHPIIGEEMERQAREYKNAKIIIYDVPLLFETGMDKKCDKVLTVVCKKEERIKRAMERSGMTREEVIKRIDRQMSDEEKVAKSNFKVDNSGTQEETFKQIEEILREILNG